MKKKKYYFLSGESVKEKLALAVNLSLEKLQQNLNFAEQDLKILPFEHGKKDKHIENCCKDGVTLWTEAVERKINS